MRRSRLILPVFIVLGAALAAGAFVVAGPFQFGRAIPAAALKASDFPAAQQLVVARLNSAPDYARFFVRLGEAFPRDQAKLVEALAAAPPVDASADLYLAQAVRSLSQTRGIQASRASSPALERIFDLQAQVAGALAKKDARLCVDFIYGGASQGYYEFAAANQKLIGDYALAGLEAIIDGQAAKIERARPGDADFRDLEQALSSASLTKPEIDAFIDGKLPDPPLPDDQLCGAGLTYFKVLKSLPEPLRIKIYALTLELMSKS